MSVKIDNYNDAVHRNGVIACLKRNYAWMNSVTDSQLYEWAKPFLTYSWKHANVEENIPCLHGQVILNDDDDVVGYLGYIYSKKVINGKSLRYMTPTTWAIDEGYRVYLFKAFKLALRDIDLAADFTARESVEEMLIKVFKFRYSNKLLCKFFPVPYIHKTNIILDKVNISSEITEPLIRNEYEDHNEYNIQCVKISCLNNQKKFYVLYRLIKRKTKNIVKLPWIEILKVSDIALFSEYTHEIIWKLQFMEVALLQCDRNFFSKKVIKHPLYKNSEVKRLFLNKTMYEFTPDFLYSEIAMLQEKL